MLDDARLRARQDLSGASTLWTIAGLALAILLIGFVIVGAMGGGIPADPDLRPVSASGRR